ncbi:TIGR02391 family protein [Streptomyces sp. G1]|uniref:TIGR02391 family protein n=1 Tax=Streptomyces sp. G1 TaxID=361572 RepID=UPI00202F60CE|nr:TIGR02391 family protein [Streptomyces sp. G1]MCM1967781.1 TIGR02391 family protein [Streptomyces sp. G1]
MTTNTPAPIPADALRTLPTPELGMLLLKTLAQDAYFLPQNNVFAKARMAFTSEPDKTDLVDRVGEAWAWLQSKALVSLATSQPSNNHRVTAEGHQLLADPSAVLKLAASERLAGPMHPVLEGHVRTNFNLGEYETACFAAMKEVEVAVRNAAGLGHSEIGVKLMRAAFKPYNNGAGGGPLADAGAEGGEQDAMAALFAGAIGAFKNPTSHRTVTFDDPIEAAEVIQLADLLLRLVERARKRGVEAAE